MQLQKYTVRSDWASYLTGLRAHPVDVIVVPPQWRARDISNEISSAGISFEQLLIEHNGALIDFRSDEHPYN